MYGSVVGGTGQIRVSASSINNNNDHTSNSNNNHGKGDINYMMGISSRYIWPKWFIFMCLASIYIAMLLTNWISDDYTTGVMQASSFGYWLRIWVAVATALIYIWTMIVPKICPDRNFVV